MKRTHTTLVSATSLHLVALLLLLSWLPAARAQAPDAGDPQGEQAEQGDAGESVFSKAVLGPKQVDLGHDLVIDLPEGYALFEQPTAGELMERMGNPSRDGLVALVTKRESEWLVTVTYDDEGYVKDDDAAKLDAAELLDSIRQGTEAANRQRQKRGIPAVEVVGWDEPPAYHADVHHLVWAVHGRSEGHEIVNFNTRVLGRRGVASLNLIDDPSNLTNSKPEAATLLAATTFKVGSRYQDFQANNDKVAEYGLAALIAGGAGAAALKVAKVGLLAKFGGKLIALLIAFKKVVIVAALGVVGFLQKLFGGGKKKAPTT